MARLLEDGLWTQEEEDDLVRREKILEGLRISSTKALTKATQRAIDANLIKAEGELDKLKKDKYDLLENTCEKFAERRSSDLIIKLSFYKENKKDPLFDDAAFDLLEREELGRLILLYNEKTGDLTSDNIKKISVADFFNSYFSLVEGNPQGFFDKPIHQLTFFQVNLLTYAQVFGSIRKNMEPPDHIKTDPDRLLAFAKSESKKRQTESRKSSQTKKGPRTL